MILAMHGGLYALQAVCLYLCMVELVLRQFAKHLLT